MSSKHDEPLPRGWEVVSVGDICNQRNEIVQPSGKGKYRFVGLEHVNSGETRIHNHDSDVNVKSSKFRFYVGDILYGKLRPYLDKAVLTGFEGICSTDLLVLTAQNEKTLAEFLVYVTHSNKFIRHAISTTSGTNHPRTSWKAISKFKFGLPPCPEQRRIAEILTTVDTAIQKVGDAIAKTERLKMGLMQELLTKGTILGFMFDTTVFGDVLDNRIDIEKFSKNHRYHVTHIQHDEISRTPNKTIRRRLLDIFQKMSKNEILTEGFVLGISRLGRAKLGTGSLLETAIKENPKHMGDALIGDAAIKNGLILVTDDTRLRNEVREHGGWAITLGDFLDDRYREFKDSEVGRIPRGWEVTTLRAECVVGTGGTPSRKQPEYFGGMVPWVKTTEVNYNIIVETGEYITELGLQNSNAKIYPAGTLIIAMYGQGVTRGKCAILGVNAAINQACAAIVPKNDNTTHVEYLQYWCQFKYDQIRNLGQGANQSNLNLSVVGSMRFPRPPLLEQHRIAEILITVDKKLELERKRKEKLGRIKKGLMNDLLTGKRRVKP